jgi:hypothetical protein
MKLPHSNASKGDILNTRFSIIILLGSPACHQSVPFLILGVLL